MGLAAPCYALQFTRGRNRRLMLSVLFIPTAFTHCPHCLCCSLMGHGSMSELLCALAGMLLSATRSLVRLLQSGAMALRWCSSVRSL